VPTVSVVIPCFQGARFLPAALASVRAQRLPPLEVIVVDDASTDGSADLARSGGATTVLRLASHQGASRARNVGIEAARGDVVAFLDADDSWEADHLERLVACLERERDADVAFALARVVRDAEAPQFNPAALSVAAAIGHEPVELGDVLFSVNPIPQSAAVVRRAALREVGGYDPTLRFAEDFDLWLRLAVRHRFVCSQAVTSTYHMHPAQATASRDAVPGFIRGRWAARVRYLEQVRASGDATRYVRLLARARTLWEADIREISRLAVWPTFDALLAALAAFPPTSPWRIAVERYWRRVRALGPAWTLIRRTWDHVPMPIRRAVWYLRTRIDGLDDDAGPAPHTDWPVRAAPRGGVGAAAADPMR
jgi:glycosyltransferase involved in cell wall biosynthesis